MVFIYLKDCRLSRTVAWENENPANIKPETNFTPLIKRSDSRNEQSSCSNRCLSKSTRDRRCPPLPGQVPVEPTETSNGRTAQGAMEASPVNKSSTEKPTECRKRKGILPFFNRLWKAIKSPFHCCCHSRDVVVVEPFDSPPDLEPEPDPEPSSPAPDHSGVMPNNGNNILAVDPWWRA